MPRSGLQEVAVELQHQFSELNEHETFSQSAAGMHDFGPELPLRMSQTMPVGQVPHVPPQPSTEQAGLGGHGNGTQAHDSQAPNAVPSKLHRWVPVLGWLFDEQGHDRTSPAAQTRTTGAGASSPQPSVVAASKPFNRSGHRDTT